MVKLYTLLFTLLLCCVGMSAQESDTTMLVITNNEAGNLPIQVGARKLGVRSLTVTGKLNGTDIAFIREMSNDGALTNLDIKDAAIVAGGNPYNGGLATANDTIGNFMFENCKNLASIVLPSKVLRVGRWAFSGCTKLQAIELPSACNSIGYYAFNGCDSLRSLSIPSNVAYIGRNAFCGCKSLKEITASSDNKTFQSIDGVLFTSSGRTLRFFPASFSDTYTIPNGTDSIARCAFWCSSIRNVTIPNTIKYIGNYAFYDCDSLLELEIPDSVGRLEAETFGNCVSLQEIRIGAKAEFDPTMFAVCTSLQRFVVSQDNGNYSSEDGVLYNADKTVLLQWPLGKRMKNINIREGVLEIGRLAFCLYDPDGPGYTPGTSIHLPSTTKAIGDNAFTHSNFHFIDMPSGISQIGRRAFERAPLENIILPDSLKEIPSELCNFCFLLEKVRIPAHIDSIANSAFATCVALDTVECEISDIENVRVNRSAFTNVSDTLLWIVPEGCERAYRQQPWWVDTWRIRTEGATPVGIKGLSIDNSALSYSDGTLSITAGRSGVIRIYSINGTMVSSIKALRGERYKVGLPKGLYVINGRKVALR